MRLKIQPYFQNLYGIFACFIRLTILSLSYNLKIIVFVFNGHLSVKQFYIKNIACHFFVWFHVASFPLCLHVTFGNRERGYLSN